MAFQRASATMIAVWIVVLMVLSKGLSSSGVVSDNSTIPAFVNIGVLYSFNTSVGRMVKTAVQAAVDDVNSDPSILANTKLKASLQEDTKYRGFLSIAEGTSFTIFPSFLCVKTLKASFFLLDKLLQSLADYYSWFT